jgi:hypothetical protein
LSFLLQREQQVQQVQPEQREQQVLLEQRVQLEPQGLPLVQVGRRQGAWT